MVKIYTTSTCPWCTKAKEYLKSLNIDFKELNVQSDMEARNEMIKKTTSIKKEIEDNAINSRVDKIYQPNKDELILFLRSKNNIKKLFISSRGNNSARIHFTKYVPENPKVPPMLCMLFRKKLCGAKLISVRQPSLERVLFLDFSAKTELAEPIKLTLVVEIMGKYSNIILIDSEEKIIDAVKRVDIQMSSKRLILPGAKYS